MVTLSTATDVSAWTVSATLRAYRGATPVATLTVGSGVTVTDSASGVFTLSFTSTHTNQTPGLWLISFDRTNAGFEFPICDPGAFVINPAAGSGPTLTNYSAYLAHTRQGASAISDTDADQLMLLLPAAEGLIKKWCNREFTYGSRTMYLNGSGTANLLLPETPVQSITSLYLDTGGWYGTVSGSFDTTTLLTAGTDYALVPDKADGYSWAGIVKRIGTTWPISQERPRGLLGYHPVACPGCVKITFVSGFAGGLVPFELQLAVWDLTTLMSRAAIQGRLPTSQSGEGYSRSFGSLEDEGKRLGSVRSILAAYRRIVI